MRYQTLLSIKNRVKELWEENQHHYFLTIQAIEWEYPKSVGSEFYHVALSSLQELQREDLIP